MVIKAVLLLLVAVELTLADPSSCPDPSKAVNLRHREEVHVVAPIFSRVERTVLIPSHKLDKHISCLTLNGIDPSAPSGGFSVAGIGVSREGITVKLVSQVKKGLDVEISAYTE